MKNSVSAIVIEGNEQVNFKKWNFSQARSSTKALAPESRCLC